MKRIKFAFVFFLIASMGVLPDFSGSRSAQSADPTKAGVTEIRTEFWRVIDAAAKHWHVAVVAESAPSSFVSAKSYRKCIGFQQRRRPAIVLANYNP